MTRLERERLRLLKDGFTQSSTFLGWSMVTSTGQAFIVTERDLRKHIESGSHFPVRWVEAN